MARRALLAVLAISILAAPAQAHTRAGATEVVFSGALPCTIVCAYWVDGGFTPCENPFPPGSYVDHVTSPAPTPAAGRIIVLEATLDMEIDWDPFLCANTAARTELSSCCTLPGDPCDNLLGDNNIVPIGCHEDLSTPLTAGQTVIFRAYNWSDPLDAIGRYWFQII